MNLYKKTSEIAAEVYDIDTMAHAARLASVYMDWFPRDRKPLISTLVIGANAIIHATVALLHDVVEDSQTWTVEGLRAEGFPEVIVEAVDAISRRKGEQYFSYINRVLRNDVARSVKLADLNDNLWGRMPPKPSLKERYEKAEKILFNGQKKT